MSDSMDHPDHGGINTQEFSQEEILGAHVEETPTHDTNTDTDSAVGPALPTATPVKVRVTQARAGTALRHAWKAFTARPIEHVTIYLVFMTANIMLPFLGLVYRLEALLGSMGRLARKEAPTLGDVILPPKARETYRVGLWTMISSVLRTDVTAIVLLTVLTIFALIPAAVLYPVSTTLFASVMFLSADAAIAAYLPLAFVGIVISGTVWVLTMTYARLLAGLPASRLNSAVHLHLLVTAAATMRRHLGFVFKAALIPAGLWLGLGIVGGGLFALTSEFLPLSHIFLMTAIIIPTLLVLVAFHGAFSFQVAETLAATVDTDEVARYEGISLSARIWGVVPRAWHALMSAGQTSYLVVFAFLASALLLGVGLLQGLNNVSSTYVGVFAVVAASFTALAALNARKGERQ